MAITTVTPNPSIDQTSQLSQTLAVGQVQYYDKLTQEAAGKGVNVSRVVLAAGVDTSAIFPAQEHGAYVRLLATQAPELATQMVGIQSETRINVAITDPEGTTTKINGHGMIVDQHALDGIYEIVENTAATHDSSSWVVLSGSLPQGVDPTFYKKIVESVHNCLTSKKSKISFAVDTSGAPLKALFSTETVSYPDLIKPNGAELAELLGATGEEIFVQEKVFEKNPSKGAQAAAQLIEQTHHRLGSILLTLGSAGTILVYSQDSTITALHGVHTPIKAVSTVGAGDSCLAGYLIGLSKQKDREESLKLATSYGAQAASLPGTAIVQPDEVDISRVTISPIDIP